MNVCYLIGRSGADAELKYTQQKKPVLNLSIATSAKIGNEWKSTWHKVVFFGEYAEKLAPQVKKGTELFVQGKIEHQEWERDKVKHQRTYVIAFIIKVIAKQEEARSLESEFVPSFNESDILF